MKEDSAFLSEAAPTNSTGSAVDNWNPILISLVRRSMPNLIAYDVCGVQPMTGPTGLIFAMRARFSSQTGAEALADEAMQDFSNQNAAGTTGGGDITDTATGHMTVNFTVNMANANYSVIVNGWWSHAYTAGADSITTSSFIAKTSTGSGYVDVNQISAVVFGDY